jgi:hypothetical protein
MMEKVDSIVTRIEKMASDYEDMKAKVAKFSKEPAGEPIKLPKNIAAELNAYQDDALSALVRTRANAFKKNKIN